MHSEYKALHTLTLTLWPLLPLFQHIYSVLQMPPNFLQFSKYTDSFLQYYTLTHAMSLPRSLPFSVYPSSPNLIPVLSGKLLLSCQNPILMSIPLWSFPKFLKSIFYMSRFITLKYFGFTSDIAYYLVACLFSLNLRFLRAKRVLFNFTSSVPKVDGLNWFNWPISKNAWRTFQYVGSFRDPGVFRRILNNLHPKGTDLKGNFYLLGRILQEQYIKVLNL